MSSHGLSNRAESLFPARRPRAQGGLADLWARMSRNQLSIAGGVAVLLLVLLALLAPLLPLANPDLVDSPNRLRLSLGGPNLLGTDEFGRDLLSRLIWGARISLAAGLGASALAMVVGVSLGLVSGYFGGAVEQVTMRVTDMFMAFPYLLLGIAIAAALGPGLFNAMLAIGVAGFPLYARIVRSSVLSIKEREYVEASRTLGATDRRILLRHILPNSLSPIIVTTSLDIGNKIIATASLSFLGLGTQPPTADWGSMLATGRSFVMTAPHVATLPGLAVFVAVLGFNLLGDGLRDAFDPRLKE